MFERKKALKEIEEKLNTVQMYLENNYKVLKYLSLCPYPVGIHSPKYRDHIQNGQ